MGGYRVLAAVPVRSRDTAAIRAFLRQVRQRLMGDADAAEQAERVCLGEERWVEAHWRGDFESDQQAGIWALRRLRAAMYMTRRALLAGSSHEDVTIDNAFAVTVEEDQR